MDSRDDLNGRDGRPAQSHYHARDWERIHTAEGFVDPHNGQIVLLRRNIQVREGETPALAAARVILHERVGHLGINAVLDTDPRLKDRWAQLSASIPPADLASLRQRYPHLPADSPGLALEWLAHQTGDRLASGSLQPGTLPAQMWQTLRDWVARTFHTLSGGRLMTNDALDAHVRELIHAAQKHSRPGSNSSSRASTTRGGTFDGSSSLNFSQPQPNSPTTTDTTPEEPPAPPPYQPKGAVLDLADFPPHARTKTDEQIDQEYDADLADSTDRRNRKNAGEQGLVMSHYIERHGEQVTDQQLQDRCIWGIDPITGTTTDGDHGGDHGFSKYACRFTTRRSLITARDAILNSSQYVQSLADPAIQSKGDFAIKLSLSQVFGSLYAKHVTGYTRVGPAKKVGTTSVITNFTNTGYVFAKIKRDSKGKWRMVTLYPHPI